MADDTSTAERWAYFRHAVIGTLLIAPPEPGQLRAALTELSRKSFAHPVTGVPMRVGFSTLEKWYYAARSGDDPCAQLRRKVRKDAGQQRAVSELLLAAMQAQYKQHPTWSYALHYKNFDALIAAGASLGPLPSYPTVRRALKARGMVRRRRSTDHKAEQGPREVRSFEMPHAHALWHLDFHHGKRNVMCPDGALVVPKLLAVLDDHTRVCCHAQWYLEEGAEQLVHALRAGVPQTRLATRDHDGQLDFRDRAHWCKVAGLISSVGDDVCRAAKAELAQPVAITRATTVHESLALVLRLWAVSPYLARYRYSDSLLDFRVAHLAASLCL